jgi:large subunit ribosomal protein L17
MRHHNANRKFGREKDQRNALMKSLALSLVEREKIKTTEAKAKELRPYVEKMITKGKIGTIASRRLLTSRLGSESGAKKICDTLSPNYTERAGGYLRITKLPSRANDAAKMAQIEFV